MSTPIFFFLIYSAFLSEYPHSRALNKADPTFPVAAIPASLLYQAFGGLDIRSTAGLRLPKVGAAGFPDDNTLPFYQSFQTLILKK